MTSQIIVLRLERAAHRLSERLATLEERLQDGDTATWTAYTEAAGALAQILPAIAPGRHGALLTTAEMAERLGVSSKTVLKRKARGEIRPALVMGKRGKAALRWRGDEVGR